jgi:hypothetical protein
MVAAVGTPSALGVVVWHDPWLNWDFDNLTGTTVNDFEIIVANSSFNPNGNDPTQVLKGMPFPNFTVTNGDYDGVAATIETKLTWSGADLNPGATAHGGLWMQGSGLVLDAYWTKDGVKVGNSTAITYEQTRVEGDPLIYMELSIAPGFFLDEGHPEYPFQEAGWKSMRTFVNIPASELALADLNDTLDLSTLAAYEVQPRLGSPEGDLIELADEIIVGLGQVQDIFLADILPEFANDGYEALLYAEVLNQTSGVIGEFWNLNPQSPEPGTALLLAIGAVGLLVRRKK